jgi:hypothetical protein
MGRIRQPSMRFLQLRISEEYRSTQARVSSYSRIEGLTFMGPRGPVLPRCCARLRLLGGQRRSHTPQGESLSVCDHLIAASIWAATTLGKEEAR